MSAATTVVIPAKAGISLFLSAAPKASETPAFAGVTGMYHG
ncbi:hypothetical protein IL54_4695 [Sphingobium sp. ba1]|jgi:hypothetical protein|nr:hypothetical protein IL54_4695 [Sphingobium sp. ba1]